MRIVVLAIAVGCGACSGAASGVLASTGDGVEAGQHAEGGTPTEGGIGDDASYSDADAAIDSPMLDASAPVLDAHDGGLEAGDGVAEASCTPVVPAPIVIPRSVADAHSDLPCGGDTPVAWALLSEDMTNPQCRTIDDVPVQCQCAETYNCACVIASGVVPTSGMCASPASSFTCSMIGGAVVFTCGR